MTKQKLYDTMKTKVAANSSSSDLLESPEQEWKNGGMIKFVPGPGCCGGSNLTVYEEQLLP
jgi:hypothetical protein